MAAPAPTVLAEQRVTATTLPTTPAAASQHVTVLDRADLDALRGRSLIEVLAGQAGVVIDRGSRSGGYGALYLRGADPSHVVVLVDHVRQNDPLSSRGSAVDLGGLSVDDIERIEIVRGTASVANADAIAGLIHIFTRRGTPGAEAGVGLGGSELRSGHARWRGTAARIGATWHEDGDRADGHARTRAANLGWETRLGEALSVQVAGRFSDSEQRGFPDESGGPLYAQLRGLENRRADSRQVSLRADHDGAAGAIELQLVSFARDGDEATPGVAPGPRDPAGLPAMSARSDYTRDEAQVTWHRSLGTAVLATAGMQHQRERGRLRSLLDFGVFQMPASFAQQRATSSVFAEARWQGGNWTAQGGVRHERRSDSGNGQGGRDSRGNSHPMLSLRYAPAGDRGQWGASLARASKAPSFFALAHPLVGNPNLRVEVATQHELYYASAADATWPTRVTVFRARYRDLVDFEAGPPPRLVNRARIEADGIEWRCGRALGETAWLQFDGAWMRVRDPDGGVQLRHRPRLQLGAQVSLPLAGDSSVDLAVRHLGTRNDSSIATGDRQLAAVTTIDLGLRRQFGPMQALLAVDNLGDTRREQVLGTPVPGRRLRLALQWSLQ